MIRMLLLLLIVADASCASGDVKSGQEQQTLNIAVIEDVPQRGVRHSVASCCL